MESLTFFSTMPGWPPGFRIRNPIMLIIILMLVSPSIKPRKRRRLVQEPPERPSRAARRGRDDKCVCNQCWGHLCCHTGYQPATFSSPASFYSKANKNHIEANSFSSPGIPAFAAKIFPSSRSLYFLLPRQHLKVNIYQIFHLNIYQIFHLNIYQIFHKYLLFPHVESSPSSH